MPSENFFPKKYSPPIVVAMLIAVVWTDVPWMSVAVLSSDFFAVSIVEGLMPILIWRLSVMVDV